MGLATVFATKQLLSSSPPPIPPRGSDVGEMPSEDADSGTYFPFPSASESTKPSAAKASSSAERDYIALVLTAGRPLADG